MSYKLIKLPEGYIIVSDEDIKENNFMFIKNKHPKGQIRKCYYIVDNTQLMIDAKEARGFGFCKREEVLKIIASTFIPELPNIDFNGLEEEFGIIDVEKLANNQFDEDTKLTEANVVWFETQDVQFNSFIKGFNKCLSLNKDKLYTEEDLREAIKLAQNYTCDVQYDENDERHEILKHTHSENMIIQSLQYKTEWNIEIDTEEKEYGHVDDYNKPHGFYKVPKLNSSGNIKIALLRN